jgi:hypothetical protein
LACAPAVILTRIFVLRGESTAHHAATAVCWLSTATIFRQPSILRNLICPLATRLKARNYNDGGLRVRGLWRPPDRAE